MKLSEFKEKIIEVHGKEMWEKIENSVEYKLYNSTREKQIDKIKDNGFNLLFVEKPTAELLEIAIETIGNTYELVYLLCFIENDLDKTFRVSKLRNMTLEEIKELLNE